MNAYVVPWHPRRLQDRNCIVHELVDLLEIEDTGIIVILSREQRAVPVRRMDIRKRVSVGVPAPVTEIETSNASPVIINYDDLDEKKYIERLIDVFKSLMSRTFS